MRRIKHKLQLDIGKLCESNGIYVKCTLHWMSQHIHEPDNHTTLQWFKKNAPTLADYNYDLVQSILIIFSKLFPNDHRSCLVVKFSTSPHTCCHYTLWNTMLYFALITLLIAKKYVFSSGDCEKNWLITGADVRTGDLKTRIFLR